MSTTATNRSFKEASKDAEDFARLFAGCVERWRIAGSVRRRAREVSDVEHVVIPKFDNQLIGGLFAEPVNLLWQRLDALVADGAGGAGKLTKHLYGNGFRWGPKYRGVDFRGFNHEIFSADGDNFGKILAIRTGPADFSHRLVTEIQKHGYWDDDGYTWDKHAVRCPCGWTGPFVDLNFVDELPPGVLAKYTNGHNRHALCPTCGHGDELTMPRVPVPDEKRYFELCGVPWAEPEDRR